MKNNSKISIIILSFLLVFLTIGVTISYAQDSKDQKKKIQEGKFKGLKELYKMETVAK